MDGGRWLTRTEGREISDHAYTLAVMVNMAIAGRPDEAAAFDRLGKGQARIDALTPAVEEVLRRAANTTAS